MNNTVTINVRDVIRSYCFVSRSDSINLSERIVKELKDNNKVILDFSEIEHCSSYFDSLFEDLYLYDLDKPDEVKAIGFKDKENEKNFNSCKEQQKKTRIEVLEYNEKHPEMKKWDEERRKMRF